MAKKFSSKIVTANDLLDGEVIYFTSANSWSVRFQDAVVANNEEQAGKFLQAANGQSDRVVGAYLTGVHTNDQGKPQPAHFREAFRSRGPSNYFHGKQAEV